MRNLVSAALLCPFLMSCGLTASCSGAETPPQTAASQTPAPQNRTPQNPAPEKPPTGTVKARAPDKLDQLLRPPSAGLPGATDGPIAHGASAAPDFGAGPAAPIEPTAAVRITVTGTARNAAMGAVLVRDDGRVWYLDGLSEWPDALLDKAVSVTGTARQRKLAPDPTVGPDGAVSHGMQGMSSVLMSPHWKAL